MAEPTSILDHDDDDPLLTELRRWSNARERAQASLRSEDLRQALAPIPRLDMQRIERLRAQIPHEPVRKPWWSWLFAADPDGHLGMGHILRVAGCGVAAGALAFWLTDGHEGKSSLPNRNDWAFEIQSPRAIAGTEASADCVKVTSERFLIRFRPRRTGVGEHEVRLFEESGDQVRPLFDGKVFNTDEDFLELSVDPKTDLSASASKRILVAQIGSPGANCELASQDLERCIRIERCIELPPQVDGSE